jgi:thiol-disulfide isomerase/thioredoxin
MPAPRFRRAVCRGSTALLWLVGALAGCSEAERAPADSAAAVAAAPVKVAVVDRAAYQKAIDAHRGNVVLVDYWATFCGPCVKQFPHTVELWHKYHGRGLDVISLSFDDAEQIGSVRKFLAENGATFENLISKVGASEESAEEFDFDGALPHYVLYDREGQVAERISPSDPTRPAFRPDMIDAALEKLLAAQPAQ